MDCKACKERYDTVKKRPQSLPCGYTICFHCVEELMDDVEIHCPRCKKHHRLPEDASSFPYNFELEEALNKLQDFWGQRVSQSVRKILTEQMMEKVAIIQNQYMKAQSDFNKDLENLEKRVSEYGQLLEYVANMHDHLLYINDCLKETTKKYKRQKTAGENFQKALEKTEGSFTDSKNIEELNKALTDGEECTKRMEGWMVSTKSLVSNSKFSKIEEMAAELIETVDPMIKKISSIESNKYFILNNETGLDLEFSSLSEMTKKYFSVKNLANASSHFVMQAELGSIVALVRKCGSKDRCAKITSDGNFIYLHHLKDGSPPENSIVINYDEKIDYNTSNYFFDLQWPGSEVHRIVVSLDVGKDRAEHFAHLCTGWLGPSYAGHRLSNITYRGCAGERILGGNYDGLGGRPVMEDISKDKTFSDWEPGCIGWEQIGQDDFNASFYITTKSYVNQLYNKFGNVVEGLETLTNLSKSEGDVPFMNLVSLVDCGAAISMVEKTSADVGNSVDVENSLDDEDSSGDENSEIVDSGVASAMLGETSGDDEEMPILEEVS